MERSPAAPAELASRLSPRAEREPARPAPIDLGEGASGELPVTKPGARAGRRDLPDVDRGRFVASWLRTGDLLRRDERGFFDFRGRSDDRFVRGGANLCPIEVESLLRHGLAHGAAYARPRRIFPVQEPPLTGSGEIDRQVIARKLHALRAALAPVRDA